MRPKWQKVRREDAKVQLRDDTLQLQLELQLQCKTQFQRLHCKQSVHTIRVQTVAQCKQKTQCRSKHAGTVQVIVTLT